MASFPDDELEFRLNWTHKAAENSILGGMVHRLRENAGKAFIRKEVDVANALMRLSDEVERDANRTHQELGEYIAEDGRREHDFRTKMKAPRPKPTVKRG